jgi:hypothetical protein
MRSGAISSNAHRFDAQVLRDRLKATEYGLTQGLLASLPSREAITTNYDTLFESACDAIEGDRPAVLPYESARPEGRWLLKLHGCIARDESIVLTRSDYLDIPSRHGALFGLVQAMLMTRHMFFVGYSLSDEDFHQLIHEVRLARGENTTPEVPSSQVDRRLGTTLSLFDDPLCADFWRDDVRVVPMAEKPRRANRSRFCAGREVGPDLSRPGGFGVCRPRRLPP